ncbi:hypothetical protein OC845_000539 [Tilletia horrida]|nr:hypothetical protein OC845_000539 [Tilletia horrida]
MLGWKIRNLSITLLLASIVGLAAAQPSSVHDIDVDGSAGIFGRATHTGKFVGSTCKTNAECYSQYCAAVGGSTTKKCQRQPAGGPCFKDANCASRNCRASANICITPSKTNGTCSADKDCVSGLSCDSGKCKAKVGSKCTKTGDCMAATPIATHSTFMGTRTFVTAPNWAASASTPETATRGSARTPFVPTLPRAMVASILTNAAT